MKLAAIDLGSNSFRLEIARVEGERIITEGSWKETIRLAAGIDKDGNLTQEAQDRGLNALARIAEKIRGLPRNHIRAVGTQTLRAANNSQEFIERAEKILDCKVEILRGKEEARLVFQGCSFALPPSDQTRLIVDIGGGTTGLALLKDGKVVEIADEPTGGTHLTLVLSGNYHIPFAEAEAIKQDYSRHREILPILKPVIEKMATIVKKNIVSKNVDTIYLCGGTCCLTGMEKIIEKETGIPTIKPADPFLVTPTGIAMNCKV